MTDKLFAKIDNILDEKKRKEEERLAKEAEKLRKLEEAAEENSEIIRKIIRPALENVSGGLEGRGIAVKITSRPKPENSIKIEFNPSGRISVQKDKNAHVEFILATYDIVRVLYSTGYNSKTGESSSAPSLNHDDNLSDNIQDAVVSVVIKTLD